MYKYTIYLGLRDKDNRNKIQNIKQSIAVVANIILFDFELDGCNIVESNGFYIHNDKEIIEEPSLIITLIEKYNLIDIPVIIDRFRLVFNQESILYTTETLDGDFYNG